MSTTAPSCVIADQWIGATTYYSIGGHAAFYGKPKSLAQLSECLTWARSQQLPIAVIGCGSNSLLADEVFNGLVLTLSDLTLAYWETNELLYVEAGVSNTEVAEICLDAGRAGAAWMYRMPGQIGATVRMNARCYGGEISQIARDIFTMDIHGQLRIYSGQEVFYGYKKTLLMDSPEVVVAARLHLPNIAQRDILLSTMEGCEADRHRKHHFDHPSCGSTFKNNYTVGRPSGQIFDECGLKGTRRGEAEVSQFHANFVWNLGRATANDMLSLAAFMREQALSQKNADLELEVQPIGLFSQKIFHDCALDRLGPSVEENNSRWVGLLWHPSLNETKIIPPMQVEKVILESPFLGYFRTPGAGQTDLFFRLVQTMSLAQAARNPDIPFLRWETHRRVSSKSWEQLFPHPPKQNPGFMDELWNYSVSELFIAAGDSNSQKYMEFECTPFNHWVAIAFDGPRKRSSGHEHPSASHWPNPQMQRTESCLAFSFSYALLAPLIYQSKLRIQACLSLGGEGWYLAPHWAPSGSKECWDTQHKPDVKPDFHQPHRFWRVALF